jgi:hypothetical protein
MRQSVEHVIDTAAVVLELDLIGVKPDPVVAFFGLEPAVDRAELRVAFGILGGVEGFQDVPRPTTDVAGYWIA